MQPAGIEPALRFLALIKSQEPNHSATIAFVTPMGLEPILLRIKSAKFYQLNYGVIVTPTGIEPVYTCYGSQIKSLLPHSYSATVCNFAEEGRVELPRRLSPTSLFSGQLTTPHGPLHFV